MGDSLQCSFRYTCGAVMDFLDRHLPEQFRQVVERAWELLPMPELQQPEQEHTWTSWSCKESLSRGGMKEPPGQTIITTENSEKNLLII